MKGLWWKLLSIALILYVFLAGLLVPLKPGIRSVTPFLVEAGGEVALQVEGYNSHFAEAGNTRAWLRLGRPNVAGERDIALLASRVETSSDQNATLYFTLPAYLPSSAGSASATLILDNSIDGAFVLPGGVQIKQTSELSGPPSPAAWSDQIEDLHSSKGMSYPYLGQLAETIRNQYFHVSLWFALMILMLTAAVYAGRYLISGNSAMDRKSKAITSVGLGFGILGLLTGMIWAHYAWGKAWSGDVKQNMTAIALLIYAAYFILRGSLNSEQQAARVGAVYNIFSFVMLIPLLYIIPRMYSSLHPGNGGNPGFGGEDLDNTMRMVFYPGIIGFTLLGIWISQLWWRTEALREKLLR